jgi:hypothetical protein
MCVCCSGLQAVSVMAVPQLSPLVHGHPLGSRPSPWFTAIPLGSWLSLLVHSVSLGSWLSLLVHSCLPWFVHWFMVVPLGSWLSSLVHSVSLGSQLSPLLSPLVTLAVPFGLPWFKCMGLHGNCIKHYCSDFSFGVTTILAFSRQQSFIVVILLLIQ